jgi:hypothetical protein
VPCSALRCVAQVIAASALIINEAQQLLEVAEPAWQYDSYNMIWEVMAKDQQLESRIKALEVKVRLSRGLLPQQSRK